jgi:L-amino acid N-acyltransferase YncA
VIVRAASDADLDAVTRIYGHHVLNGLGTFEETPPRVADMGARKAAVDALGLPYLVADDGGVVGYAYAAPFRTRAAYRYTVEDSVYVAPDRMGRGVGKALVGRLIEACEAMGLRQMLAVIGDSANAGSIGLHAAMGFDKMGVTPGLGFKFGHWVDVVWILTGGARSIGPRWRSVYLCMREMARAEVIRGLGVLRQRPRRPKYPLARAWRGAIIDGESDA